MTMLTVRNPILICMMVLSTAASTYGTSKDTQSVFTYEDLVSIIKAKNLKSVEEVIPHFPLDMRSNFTLMYDSQSLQEASPLFPRAILFGTDAKLTCTFNGDKSQKGFETLECFQYRSKTRSFDFREIVFPTEENGLKLPVFSESNKQALGKIHCAACHGADPRPNWEPYSTWPGAYGSRDDNFEPFVPQGPIPTGLIAHRAKEKENFLKFKENYLSSARYQSLVFLPGRLSPYSDVFKSTDFGLRPNLRLTLAMEKLVVQRNVRLLQSRGDNFQFNYLRELARCDSSKDNLTEKLTVSPENVLKEFFSPFDWTPAFRSLNLACDDCNFDDNLGSTKYAIRYMYGDGYADFNQYIAFELIRDLVAKGRLPAEVLKKATITRTLQKYGISSTVAIEPKKLGLFCSLLSAKPK